MGFLRAKAFRSRGLITLLLALLASIAPIAFADSAARASICFTSNGSHRARACSGSTRHLDLRSREKTPPSASAKLDKFCGKDWVKREVFNHPTSFLRHKSWDRALTPNDALAGFCLSDLATALSGWSASSIKRGDKAIAARPLLLLVSRFAAQARIPFENRSTLPGYCLGNSNRAPPAC